MMGLTRDHGGDPCPVRASLWCAQCWCYGHLPASCTKDAPPVEPPLYTEDLISPDLRERWGIQTKTPYIPPRPLTLEDKERMIAETNTIEVRYRDGKQDSRIREVMRSLKIQTVHKMDGNIMKLRTWAVSNGKKVRLVQEK
jgi:hypothetical protein